MLNRPFPASSLADTCKRTGGYLLLASSMVLGCSQQKEGVAVRPSTVPSGAVATLGDATIELVTLQRVIADANRSVAEGLSELVDARCIGLFGDRGGLEQGRRQQVHRAVLARVMLEGIESRTKSRGEVTDAEVDALAAERWLEFDRPEAVRTCHVLVHAEKPESGGAHAIAERMARHLAPLTTCADFLREAKGLPADGAKITAEMLPPVTADGRTFVLDAGNNPIEEGPRFDAHFAEAAHRIKTVGGQSAITGTRFGWHIILLEERLPSKRVPLEERRRLLADDALRKRARDESDRVLGELRRQTAVQVERAAIESIGRLQVAP